MTLGGQHAGHARHIPWPLRIPHGLLLRRAVARCRSRRRSSRCGNGKHPVTCGKTRPGHTAGSNRVPGQSLPPDVPAQAHNSQAHVSVQQSAGPEEARGDTSPYAGRSHSALAQLAQVVEELAPHLHPHRAPDTAPEQRSVPESPAPLRTPEPLALSSLEQLMHQALRLTGRASGTRMPREVPAERDVYDAQPGPWAALHAQDREASSVDTSGSPESDQQHVLRLITSHVDHLLASDMAAPLPGVRADIQPDLAGVRSLEHGAGYAPGYADHTSGASWPEAGAGFAVRASPGGFRRGARPVDASQRVRAARAAWRTTDGCGQPCRTGERGLG